MIGNTHTHTHTHTYTEISTQRDKETDGRHIGSRYLISPLLPSILTSYHFQHSLPYPSNRFVLFRTPEAVPKLVSLLAESFNPHVSPIVCLYVI